jgi:hypothetical protein
MMSTEIEGDDHRPLFRMKQAMESRPHLHLHWFEPGDGVVGGLVDMVELCCHGCHCGVFVVHSTGDGAALDAEAASFFSRHVECGPRVEPTGAREISSPCSEIRLHTAAADIRRLR